MMLDSIPSHLAYALAYARRGWRVHPVQWPTNAGACSCNDGLHCASIGKHPLLRGWQREATTNPQTIRAWWRKYPAANVGIATGIESRLLVVDVDPRNGGDVELEALLAQHGKLESTMRVETGGGGLHFYFEHPSGGLALRSKIAPGLDVKHGGGTIVAPPSLHASGRRYTWADGASPRDVAPAPVPPWLLAELAPIRKAVPERPTRPVRRLLGDAAALDVLVRECSFVDHCAENPRALSYDEWFSLATILEVFSQGPALFETISRRDSERYRRGEPALKIASVKGKPRHCTSLGWSCPRLGKCSGFGVNSPAGLPYKLRKGGA